MEKDALPMKDRFPFLKKLVLWRDTRDAYLMIVSCMIFIFVGIVAYISNAYASIHNGSLVPMNTTPGSAKSKKPNPVFDVILEVLDQWLKKLNWEPGLTYALVFTNFSVIVLVIRLCTLGRDSFWVIRRTFSIMSIVYALRSFIISITVIPTPIPVCYYVIKETLIETAIYNFFHGNESCGDVFFSGHTILFTITVYTWLSRPPVAHSWISYLIASIIIIFGYPSLLISKLHYTIDIIGGLWFTISVMMVYHRIVGSREIKGRWYSRVLRTWDYPPLSIVNMDSRPVAVFNAGK